MKIEINDTIKVSFKQSEVKQIQRLCNVIGIRMDFFGDLSFNSPYVVMDTEKIVATLNQYLQQVNTITLMSDAFNCNESKLKFLPKDEIAKKRKEIINLFKGPLNGLWVPKDKS